jgi:hypothetical protein
MVLRKPEEKKSLGRPWCREVGRGTFELIHGGTFLPYFSGNHTFKKVKT